MKIGLSLVVIFLLSSQAIAQEAYKKFDTEQLQLGRDIWLGTCENCHAWGVADAPIPMQPDDWKPRVIKPKIELYSHAINGFFGPDDSYMPPRGGNPNLSDEEVKMAVDYMVELANFYISKTQ